MKKVIIVFIFALLATAGVAYAQNVTYDFDSVDVRYAAEFTARPGTIDPNSWIVQIAGGVTNPITVLYGVVDLKKGGSTQISEEFIDISGSGGSRRFLLNSGRTAFYPGTNKPRLLLSFFWSAKKLVNNQAVKDFTLPVSSVTVGREFNDQSQQLQAAFLTFSNDGQRALEEFSGGSSLTNLYTADMTTMRQSGLATETASQ